MDSTHRDFWESLMSIPRLSQAVIRQQATDRSWQRGQAYYHNGHV
ncbi:MAG: hypothetical protein AAF652_02705 [Cyanobacteria bacterium P01_C01_bin.72]